MNAQMGFPGIEPPAALRLVPNHDGTLAVWTSPYTRIPGALHHASDWLWYPICHWSWDGQQYLVLDGHREKGDAAAALIEAWQAHLREVGQ